MTEHATWPAEHSPQREPWPVSQVDSPVASHADSQVEEVLAAVGALDGRPVAEHVGVYESAHATLRGALDDRTD